MSDLDWRQRAACREYDPDLWFPNEGDPITRAQAVRICRDCPVQLQCATAGIREPWGIWGGLTQKARATLRGTPAHVAMASQMRGMHRPMCGTLAAYRRHYRDGEEPCEPCAKAGRRSTAEKRASR